MQINVGSLLLPVVESTSDLAKKEDTNNSITRHPAPLWTSLVIPIIILLSESVRISKSQQCLANLLPSSEWELSGVSVFWRMNEWMSLFSCSLGWIAQWNKSCFKLLNLMTLLKTPIKPRRFCWVRWTRINALFVSEAWLNLEEIYLHIKFLLHPPAYAEELAANSDNGTRMSRCCCFCSVIHNGKSRYANSNQPTCRHTSCLILCRWKGNIYTRRRMWR